MSARIKYFIDTEDFTGIDRELTAHPALANEELPYDEVNTSKAHPLHRICDGVFSKKYTDEEALEMARIFIKHGAKVDGNRQVEKQDTPLVAAASLHADSVAIYYIEEGADIHHAGCHGGTALHWAAWCGRSRVVEKLLKEGAAINKRCIDFQSTPLFWAVHGLKNGAGNVRDHFECIRILLEAGAEKNIPNAEGVTVYELASTISDEVVELLNKEK